MGSVSAEWGSTRDFLSRLELNRGGFPKMRVPFSGSQCYLRVCLCLDPPVNGLYRVCVS